MRYEVILDSGETANKCTIAPLAGRPDFRLIPVKGAGALGPLQSSILLHHEGRCLIELRESLGEVSGIACIDCVWRRLDPLIRRVEGKLPVLTRIPDGFATAYPRKSVLDTDPDGGLATIEAIFVAAAILGNWDTSLLSNYYFGRRFVELNARRLIELGATQAADDSQWPVHVSKQRSALQRRRDRGRPSLQ